MAGSARWGRASAFAALLVGLLAAPAASEEPEPDPSPEQGSTCLLKVVEGTNGVQAGLDGLLVDLAQTNSDEASPDYEGTLLSLPLKVTLWRGTPAQEIESAVSTMTSAWDSLAEESIADATESAPTDEGVDDEGTLEDPATPGQLETVAYRVQLGPLVEFGTPVANTAGSLLGCLPAVLSTLTTVTLDSPLGTFSLPKSDVAEPDNTPAVFMEGDAAAVPVPYFLLGGGTPQYITTASAPSTTSVIRYRTFIPTSTVTTKYACGTFKGDNRGFSSYYEKPARTRVSVFYDWPGRKISYSRHIGTTHRLAAYGYSAKSATASSSGIKLYYPQMSSTYGKVQVNHSVANPLCGPAGPISYSLNFEAWKNGAARLQGKRRKVPNHEAYMYPKSGANGNTILKRSTSDYMCLNVNCGDESVSAKTP